MALHPAFIPLVKRLASRVKVHRSSSEAEAEALDRIRALRGLPADAPELQAMKSQRPERFIIMRGPFSPAASSGVTQDLAYIDSTMPEKMLHRDEARGTRLMVLSRLEAAVLEEASPGLLVEQDVEYLLAPAPPRRPLTPLIVSGAAGRMIKVRVTAEGRPLAGARVRLWARRELPDGYRGQTDERGEIELFVRAADTSFAEVIIEPRDSAFSRRWLNVRCEEVMRLNLYPLNSSAPDWGTIAVGAADHDARRGEGVRVGVIDSGIARHPRLTGVICGGACMVDRERRAPEERWYLDGVGHGTHCAGTIHAVAPAAELLALRVMDGGNRAAGVYHIGQAVREAISLGCDILNLSLAGAEESAHLRRCLDEAHDAGVLCIAAAGNDGGPVAYPARWPRMIAVSALGRRQTYPFDSLHADVETEDRLGGHYFAGFSNHGPEIMFVAPGVAVVSTFPASSFAALDGTSMAAPHVAGVAASLLGELLRDHLAPRSPARAEALVERLIAACQDVGMGREQQGFGMPRLAGPSARASV